MIHEFQNPVPVMTEHGKGFVWYVRENGTFENDVFAVILCDGGLVRHYNSNQFYIEKNATFEIKNNEIQKDNNKKES